MNLEPIIWFNSVHEAILGAAKPDVWQRVARLAMEYVEKGGGVMPALLAALAILWYGLGYRWATLARAGLQDPREMLDSYLAGKRPSKPKGIVQNALARGWKLKESNPPDLRLSLDDAFGEYDRELNRFVPLVRMIVAAAPLLGLLGTVTGMIETFGALRDNSMLSQSGGIAGGISQALLTTQLGLSVAVPGLVVQEFLARRQRRVRVALDQIKDLLTSMPEQGRAGGEGCAS